MENKEILLKTEISIHRHRDRVAKHLAPIIEELVNRAADHDDSKLREDELPAYASAQEAFEVTPFGTPEYQAIKDKIMPTIKEHYRKNPHHPEHYENGISGMTLVDVIEMLCDWASATKNHDVGSTMKKSLEFAIKKYNISTDLASILYNTAKEFGMYNE